MELVPEAISCTIDFAKLLKTVGAEPIDPCAAYLK
jgi:hypothetical protein